MKLNKERLRTLFDYDGRALVWRERPIGDFVDAHACRAWNGRYAGKAAGNLQPNGYVRVTVDRRHYYAHRLIFLREHGYLPEQIDHINHVRDDNRLINLRAASRAINTRNQKMRCDNKSGKTGVYWNTTRRKWAVQIAINKHKTYVGLFRSFDEACAARAKVESSHGYHQNHGRPS